MSVLTKDSATSPAAHAGVITLLRHQLGALFTTAVDFGTMVVCVSVAGFTPVAGTALGATAGAVTNFTLSRRWIFPVEDHGPSSLGAGRGTAGAVRGQAWRYLAVSAASLAWNTLGEHLVHDLAHVQYVLARAMVAAIVSLGWNYPLHRNWVFRAHGQPPSPSSS